MIVSVERKHIRMGQPKFNRCPLALACQECFKLSWKCVEVSPMGLTMMNYHGTLVYWAKWPEEAENFHRSYFDAFKYGTQFHKLPKPFKFEIGVQRGDGWEIDTLHKVIFNIHNWYGDMTYEYPD
jgi:hypothetical protein